MAAGVVLHTLNPRLAPEHMVYAINDAQDKARSPLHPTPYTLHPTPYTLHPTPYTLHPTPYTLNLTPYTLHPTPLAPKVYGVRYKV